MYRESIPNEQTFNQVILRKKAGSKFKKIPLAQYEPIIEEPSNSYCICNNYKMGDFLIGIIFMT